MQGQAQADVLRHLTGGWLECLDQQGIFYYNQTTKQTSDTMPPGLQPQEQEQAPQAQAPQAQAPQAQAPQAQAPQAQAQADVLRSLSGGWAECRDQQGIFYYNIATKQSSDTMPPGVHPLQQSAPSQHQAAPAPTPVEAQAQADVLRSLSGGWLECRDQLGIFYYNQTTKQTSESMPPGVQPLQQGAPVQQQAPMAQMQQAANAPAQEQPVVKLVLGDWKVCEDSQGEFYFHTRTNQSFDQPPQELVNLYRASTQGSAATQQSQQPAHMKQMQQTHQMYSQKSAVNQQSSVAAYPQAQSAVVSQYYSQIQQQGYAQPQSYVQPQSYGQQNMYGQGQPTYGQQQMYGHQYPFQNSEA